MIKKINKNNILVSSVVTAIGVAVLLAPLAGAQADVTDEVMTEYARLAKSGSDEGQDWFDLAQKARSAGKLDIANQALARAGSLEFSPIRLGLEQARISIAADEPAAAVTQLQGVFDGGFTSVAVLVQDTEINSLAGREDYDGLIEAMSVQAYPCRHQPGFGDFDFWIGDWDVAVANGTAAGTNSIQPAERGCVLMENWTNTSGGTGMSINYLDMATNEWVQVWNAEGGSQINVRGGLTDEGMAMEGTLHVVGSGTTLPFRALWTPLPDGRVRQYFEQSNDNGATWTPWFEGFYTRKD